MGFSVKIKNEGFGGKRVFGPGSEFHTKVVGVTKRNDEEKSIQSILKEMQENDCEGELVELEHEEDNQYDENAIKVIHDGNHIGYINRELAAEIVEFVDAGMVDAEISDLTGGEDGKTRGCNLLIQINGENPVPASTYISYHQQAGEGLKMKSEFYGDMWQMIGWQIVCVAITIFTLGIAYPWGACFLYRWEAEHSTINGKRLKFTGTGGNLFLLYLKLYFGFIGILIGISVLIVAFSHIHLIVILLALCAIAVLVLFGSYVLLRIKRWRVEHTEFLHRDPPAQRAQDQYDDYFPTNSPAPPASPRPKFSLTSRDLVTVDGMMEYCRYFMTDNGENEQVRRSLFARAASVVPPDPQVTMTFMAKMNGMVCACALANSKLIIADEFSIRTYHVEDISGVDYTEIGDCGELTIKQKGEDVHLQANKRLAASLSVTLMESIKECQDELMAKA